MKFTIIGEQCLEFTDEEKTKKYYSKKLKNL
jgi:hypothetical protein